jgi:F-type H+-transporting ATPase subunit alpha
MAELVDQLRAAAGRLEGIIGGLKPELSITEYGIVESIGPATARISGLPGAQAEEVVLVGGRARAMVFNLEPDYVDLILLDRDTHIQSGDEVRRTGRVVDVPVGEALLGRVVDPLGRPLDGRGDIRTDDRSPIERDAPGIMDRSPVTVPLQTGIIAVDSLVPIGRGQRELIIGDRQTGKTAIAVDAIINQQDKGVLCVYCAIGQRSSSVAGVIGDLRNHDAMERTVVVSAGGHDAPGLNYIAPYAATAMAEFFVDQGKDVVIVYDDLTRHARAYRELSLLLRRPPAREAYPGDIFYIHSRLLERATHLKQDLGGGALTALPIVETQAQNMSAYIPTNLISITDGQILLTPDLFQQGVMPAVEVGRSVSRVGGKTQLAAYREVTGDLRLSYSQFHELESFSRFGVRLEDETRKTLERGRRVREILKQRQYEPMPQPEQIGVLLALTEGLFDDIPIEEVTAAKDRLARALRREAADALESIEEGNSLNDESREDVLRSARAELAPEREEQE